MKSLLLGVALLLSFASAVAAQNQPATLAGQIVCCEDCWTRADRKTVPYGTAEDLAKAQGCVANGDPTLLAVVDSQGDATLYQLEDGKFRRPGKDWLEFIGRRVEITGPVRAKGAARFVKVDALKVLAPAIAEARQANMLGTQADLTLKDLSGVEQRLTQFRGRVVVLNFWATYCAPCRKEMPDLAAIQNEYAPLGVQVIGASADTAGERAKVLQFIRETKLNFPVWLGATVEDMAKFGLGPALPGTAIIDREGKIVWLKSSPITESELKKQLVVLLASTSSPASAATSAPAEDPHDPTHDLAQADPGDASAVPS